MNQITTLVQTRFPSLVLLGVAAGFVMLLAELLLTGHTEGTQRIAVLMSVLGIGLGLMALWVSGWLRGLVIAGFALLALAGVYGALEHQEGGEGREAQTQRFIRERGEGEATPPPLAPLSLSGLALLGGLATLAKRGEAA